MSSQERTEHGPIVEAELHAYVDDQLDVERRRAVEAYLATDAEARARVAAWSEQNRLLGSLYDPALDEPVPPQLSDVIAEARGRAARPAWWWQAAAAVVLLALGAAGGWFGAHWFEPPPTRLEAALPREAALAHRVFVVEKRHPVEVAANERDHLVTWLSRRMGAKVSAPDLSSIGWNLVGGRLLSALDGPACQLMYEDRAGRRVTVYMTRNPAHRETAFLFRIDGAVRSFFWLDGPLGYAITGEIDRAELMPIAKALYDNLR
jgi:anti-sigma factor RsiW